MAATTDTNQDLPPKEEAPKRRKPSLLAAVSMLTSIAALGFSLYTFQQHQLNKQLLDQGKSSLTEQLNALRQAQSHVEGLVDTNANNLQQAETAVNEKINHLLAQLQKSQQEAHYQKEDWYLLKLRYYMELAQINAHWTSDRGTTIALLHQADSLLQQLTDPRVYNLRQSIAKDLAVLESMTPLDIPGILSQIDAASASIETLSTPSAPNDMPVTADKEESSSTTQGWHKHLEQSLGVLQKLVIIRRNDEPSKPLMSPLYDAITKESLRLNLQEAQWAVLTRNQTIYDFALKQAISTLNRVFGTKTPAATALLNQLTQLQTIKLTETKPEIGSGLILLNGMLNKDNSPDTSAQPVNKGDKPS